MDDYCYFGSSLASWCFWWKSNSELPKNWWVDPYADRDRSHPPGTTASWDYLTGYQLLEILIIKINGVNNYD